MALIDLPPDDVYEWCTETGNRVEPPSEYKLNGFGAWKPGRGLMNDLLGRISAWTVAAMQLLKAPIGHANGTSFYHFLRYQSWVDYDGEVTPSAGGSDSVRLTATTPGSSQIELPPMAAGGTVDTITVTVNDRSNDSCSVVLLLASSGGDAVLYSSGFIAANGVITLNQTSVISGSNDFRGPVFGRLTAIVAASSWIEISVLNITFNTEP